MMRDAAAIGRMMDQITHLWRDKSRTYIGAGRYYAEGYAEGVADSRTLLRIARSADPADQQMLADLEQRLMFDDL